MSQGISDIFDNMLSVISVARYERVTTHKVSKNLQVSKRTAQRYIKALIDQGYLERKERYVIATRKAYGMIVAGEPIKGFWREEA
ncbi:HTH domain-containing protein [Acinetobacter sp. SA01]|uniref:HTH domain-containing protein n=1 Tax=Acinetobacter sp. SA01 TaxID=1862567 RepID=UPI001407293F